MEKAGTMSAVWFGAHHKELDVRNEDRSFGERLCVSFFTVSVFVVNCELNCNSFDWGRLHSCSNFQPHYTNRFVVDMTSGSCIILLLLGLALKLVSCL